MLHQSAYRDPDGTRSNYRRRLSFKLLSAAVCATLSISQPPPLPAAGGARAASAGSVNAAARVCSNQVSQLAVGATVGCEIKGDEVHLFGVLLEAGQYTRVVVRKRNVDLLVTVSAPGDREATTYENPAGPESSLGVSIMAGASGTHTVKVRPVEKWAAPGSYEIRLDTVRAPSPEDEKRLAAERKVVEGRSHQLSDTEASRRAAVAAYEGVLAIWRDLGDSSEEANTLHFIAQAYKASGRSYFEKAVESYRQALARRGEDDRQARAYTLLGLGDVYRDLSNPADLLAFYGQALELFKASENRRGQAAALYSMGLARARRREMPEALKAYEQAREIYASAEARDRHEEARTLHAIGGAYDVMGEPERALAFFNEARVGWVETGDLALEGNTYSSIAKLDDDRGDWQTALDNYHKALSLYAQAEAAAERGKPAVARTRASTLYNLGFTYATLGDYAEALRLLRQSLERRDNPAGQGITLMMIGYVHALAGKPQEALEYCEQALPLQVEAGDPRQSHTFTVMGIAYAALDKHQKALELYARALEIQQNQDRPDPQAEAITQARRGESSAALGAQQEALAAYARARQLWRASKDRNGEALALYGMARAERDRGNLTAALKHAEDALAAVEPLRANVTSQQLRVSYFAAKVDYYELFIDVTMRLRDERSGAALTAAAFEASERSRSRSLLDTLAEARVEAGLKSDPELAGLVNKYRRAQRELQAKKTLREQTPKEKEGTEGAALDLEITKLRAERERAEAQLRSLRPRYAALMYPQPLTVAEVQGLLDEDTCLVEFILGEQRSYVWALTATELRGEPLPPRADIQRAVSRLVDGLTGRDRARETAAQRARAEESYRSQAASLSRTLLGPVAGMLKKKRLLIVADGALLYLPFASLPSPEAADARNSNTADAPNHLLIRDHEIVGLPSASVLSVLRQTVRRESWSKSVAVFADPIYEKDDPRFLTATRGRPVPAGPEGRAALTRAWNEADDPGVQAAKLPRLPASGREARDIISIAPPDSSWEATGFNANRENVTSARLGNYRVVHFATHGILKEDRPELSGVVLSLYDERGSFQEDGFLRLKDIYGLSLPVNMVVLSACRTGLGREARGEGLIGLTRGFMHAGAARVIASLWKVDDDATAEFMKRFYQKLFRDEMTPAAALAAAQASMSKERRWSDPYYWAGFTLQGEPK